jgi:hypothetical protein
MRTSGPRALLLLLATSLCGGCSTWTSVHGGLAVPSSGGARTGGELRAAAGPSGAPHALAGLRGEANAHATEVALQLGATIPIAIGEQLALVPFLMVEAARASRIDGSWYAGAGGPGAGLELVWWLRVKRSARRLPGASFGCFGGAIGEDCARSVITEDVVRDGIGLRVSGEHQVRFGGHAGRAASGGVIWIGVGVIHESSEHERECRVYDHAPPQGEGCATFYPAVTWLGR